MKEEKFRTDLMQTLKRQRVSKKEKFCVDRNIILKWILKIKGVNWSATEGEGSCNELLWYCK
jgi:hypothetical protein